MPPTRPRWSLPQMVAILHQLGYQSPSREGHDAFCTAACSPLRYAYTRLFISTSRSLARRCANGLAEDQVGYGRHLCTRGSSMQHTPNATSKRTSQHLNKLAARPRRPLRPSQYGVYSTESPHGDEDELAQEKVRRRGEQRHLASGRCTNFYDPVHNKPLQKFTLKSVHLPMDQPTNGSNFSIFYHHHSLQSITHNAVNSTSKSAILPSLESSFPDLLP